VLCPFKYSTGEAQLTTQEGAQYVLPEAHMVTLLGISGGQAVVYNPWGYNYEADDSRGSAVWYLDIQVLELVTSGIVEGGMPQTHEVGASSTSAAVRPYLAPVMGWLFAMTLLTLYLHNYYVDSQ
jgi:hypothetical protein